MSRNSRLHHVFIADGDAVHRALFAEYLSEENIAITCADTGEEARRMLREENRLYDCIILSRTITGIPASDIIDMLSARVNTTPIMLQSDDLSENYIRRSVNAGVYYYLAKPYTRRSFLSILRAAFREGSERNVSKEKFMCINHALSHLQDATFTVRTPEQVHNIAYTLACALPNPERSLTGISELLLNAVEHGNLGITFNEKTALLENGEWAEEVQRRLADARYAERVVTVRFFRAPHVCHIMISDEGAGFDYERYLEIDPSRLALPHGRGVALSKALAFDEMNYIGDGNRVLCAVFTNADDKPVHQTTDAFMDVAQKSA